LSFIEKTDSVPSLRLVTSASVPSGETDTSLAPSPAVTLLDEFGRRRFQVDHRDAIVGDDLVRVLRVDFARCRNDYVALIRRDPDRGRRADDTGRGLDRGDHFRRILRNINDRYGVRRRVLRRTGDPVDIDRMAVIGGDGEISRGRPRQSGERYGDGGDRPTPW
jgi:hypothetical protein